MCGIFGGWFKDNPVSFKCNITAAMHALKHRGPNDQGYEVYASSNSSEVVLGHTRLSIIDLSAGGHQPMSYQEGRYSIVFNGELYNYRELRQELIQIGHHFQTESDTEVLLAAWSQWGAEVLSRFIGMFAFVVYDQQEQTLTCVRDAFGIKPLFYSYDEHAFIVASEQKALLALRRQKAEVDLQRSYDYLVYADYDSKERSFIDGVLHLMPGHMMVFDIVSAKLNAVTAWWKPEIKQQSILSFPDAVAAVREQFLQNIKLHLRSDVPLGAALSGGIDSSAVVCAMRVIEPDAPIHTFSYIARRTRHSEESWVDLVNQQAGATAHKLYVSGDDLARDLDDMINAQGEPFGSTSIYAQYRVFQLAKESGITVTLDGQGADELFAGYNGYPGERLLSLLEQGRVLASLRFASQWSKWPSRPYAHSWMSLVGLLLTDTLHAQSGKLIGRNAEPQWLDLRYLRDAQVTIREDRYKISSVGKQRRVMEKLANALSKKGLNELLRHGDRNSMRFSIESRVPFLTVPMAELALSLPENYLISDAGQTKHVFREAMRGIVPDAILDRRDKIGFATPEKEWLFAMAPTIRNWLTESAAIPMLNSTALLAEFDAIIAGNKPFSWQLWRWVNFVRWYGSV